jgi:hypothetical protein
VLVALGLDQRIENLVLRGKSLRGLCHAEVSLLNLRRRGVPSAGTSRESDLSRPFQSRLEQVLRPGADRRPRRRARPTPRSDRLSHSLRHIGELYRARGYFVVAIRLPAHGTVSGALTEVEWEDWMAATRLAVREAQRRVGAAKPPQLAGYSNGGALALKYALDTLDDNRLERADRLILISPMIGITQFARFVGLAALPAYFPPFAKAAWLEVLPEFNPSNTTRFR